MTEIRFGTDGVRGNAGAWPIDVSGARQIGYGIGSLLRTQALPPKVIIGRDTRASGKEIAQGLTEGLLAHNLQVNDAGIITTAGIAYLTSHYGMGVGIIVSASHNPWTENGIKVVGSDGCKLNDAQELMLELLVNEHIDKKDLQVIEEEARASQQFILDYINHLIEPFKNTEIARIKIALDCSNGAASDIAPRCFQLLGCQTTVSHATPNGRNINQDCGSETVREGRGDLFEVMKSGGAQLGAAFDGDADRVVFLDEAGHLIDGDHILYILAAHFARANRLAGNTVVTTSMANHGLDIALGTHNIETVRTPVGDKYIVREIQEKGYLLGGEQSGHIIVYAKDHTTGDGIYTALLIASILASSERISLSELALPLQKLPQVIVSARVTSTPNLQLLDGFRHEYEKVVAQLGQGVIINTRYSGTEPLFRVMIEGTSQHTLMDLARCAVHLGRIVQTAVDARPGWMEVKDCSTGVPLSLDNLEFGDPC